MLLELETWNSDIKIIIHTRAPNGNIFILMTFPSLVALKVVKMTTSSFKMTTSRAANGENFYKMTTFSFQCIFLKLFRPCIFSDGDHICIERGELFVQTCRRWCTYLPEALRCDMELSRTIITPLGTGNANTHSSELLIATYCWDGSTIHHGIIFYWFAIPKCHLTVIHNKPLWIVFRIYIEFVRRYAILNNVWSIKPFRYLM